VSLIRSQFGLEQFVVAPHVQAPQGPVCLTCGRVVDSEELVEGYPGESQTAKVLVRHHGAEELRTFDMGSTNWDERDLGSMMRRTNWFDPYAHEGLGLGKVVVAPGDNVDEAVTPMVVVP
jgi:hypothetical protein